MNRSWLFSILCISLLIGSLCIAGCTRDRDDRGTISPTAEEKPVVTKISDIATTQSMGSAGNPAGSTGKTCIQLGGDSCITGEDCSGSWLDARDSFSCCSIPCSGTGGAGSVITLEPFEPSPTMDDLVDISP